MGQGLGHKEGFLHGGRKKGNEKIFANTGGCGISIEPFHRARMEVDKLSGSWRSKSGIEDRGRGLSKRRFSMIFTLTLFSVCILLFFAATATPASAAVQYTLEGYTLEPSEKWTTGAVKGWSEGDCIPYRYTVENTGGDSVSLNLEIEFSHKEDGIIGIEDFESFNVPAGTISGPTLNSSGFYWWNVTLPGGTTYTLTWCARLSNEAGLWPGAKIHVRAGGRDVPIPVEGIKIPDLYVTKTATVTCDAINYTINYGNSGDANQTGTTLVDDYDETNVTVTNAGGGTDKGNNITWSIGTVAVGASGSVSYTVSIKEGVANGAEIINSGTISGDLAERVTTNNYYSVTSYAKVSPTATAGSNSPVCVGDTIELYGGPEGMSTYSWTGPGGWTSNEQNPTRPDATLAMAGGYNLTVTDANGCTDSDTTTVVVYSKPTATAGSNSPACVGNTIELYGGPDGMSSYSWTGPGGWASNEQNPTRPDATLAMAGGYTLTVTDTHGCTDSATTTVVVYSKPTATAGSNSPVCVGDTIELYGGPEGMSSYSWTGPGGWTSNEQNPTRPDATLAMAGEYTLTVTDANGCTDSATTTVVVYSKPKPKPPFPLITPPQQPQYFTEKSSVQGEGEFRIEKKIVDRAIAIDVRELIQGNGSFAMESEERLNESATNRSIEDNYEHTKMIQFDSGVMIGTARYSSSFQGGSGPSVEEFFAVTEMQKMEDVSIYTTADVGDKQVLDFDTMDEIEGTWGTRAEWSKPCKKKIELEQTFEGDFAIQKELVFEEKVIECKKDC